MSEKVRLGSRHSRRRFVQTSGAVGLTLAASARGDLAVAQSATPEADAQAPYYEDTEGPPEPGGAVRFLLYEDPNSLNPILGSTSIAIQVVAAIQEGLTRNDPDGTFVPLLAAELPTQENGGISEDLLTVTWTLKEGVTWSDGEPFTSADVLFTWEAARDAANGSTAVSDYQLVTDVQTPDPLTVVVTTPISTRAISISSPGFIPGTPPVTLPTCATGRSTGLLSAPARSSSTNGRPGSSSNCLPTKTTGNRASPIWTA